MSALHHASQIGYENIVNYLLSTLTSPEKDLIDLPEKVFGQTALHKAAAHRQHKICEMLASWGASLTKPDYQGLTPKQLAVKAGDEVLAANLERKHFCCSSLCLSCPLPSSVVNPSLFCPLLSSSTYLHPLLDLFSHFRYSSSLNLVFNAYKSYSFCLLNVSFDLEFIFCTSSSVNFKMLSNLLLSVKSLLIVLLCISHRFRALKR